jgi:hypothetical protein
MEGFRVAALRGFRRVFAHAAPIFFERGIAVDSTKVRGPFLYPSLTNSSLILEILLCTSLILRQKCDFQFLSKVIISDAVELFLFCTDSVTC